MAEAPEDGLPEGWSFSVDGDRVDYQCAACLRTNIRAIEEARLRRGWTLRRLSREARLSYPTVINLLLGRTKPNFGTQAPFGGPEPIAAFSTTCSGALAALGLSK